MLKSQTIQSTSLFFTYFQNKNNKRQSNKNKNKNKKNKNKKTHPKTHHSHGV